MRFLFIALLSVILSLNVYAGEVNVTGTGAAYTSYVFSVTADQLITETAAVQISGATIYVATATALSVQVVCVSPTVQTSGVLKDLVITPKFTNGGLSIQTDTNKEFLSDSSLLISTESELPVSAINRLGFYRINEDSIPRYMQLIYNFKKVDNSPNNFSFNTSTERCMYYIYIKVKD